MMLAPIVLFVYNRLWHTQQTINALKNNYLAKKSELFIYSDGSKDSKDEENVNKVREYIKQIKGFKKITIIERKRNWGLANNIIEGVTNIIDKFGKIIVLEDDIVTSKYFLKFMNDALNIYENKKKVWHISGWNYPIDIKCESDIFLWRVMNCWGWATWYDRWKYYKRDVDKLINEFSKKDIKRFNLDGVENFWRQVIANKKRKINTWAIFWYATIFKNEGLCLNPCISYAKNIGLDGSGVHCKSDNRYDNFPMLNNKRIINFNVEIKENNEIVEKIKLYYLSQRKFLLVRIVNKISRIVIKKK